MGNMPRHFDSETNRFGKAARDYIHYIPITWSTSKKDYPLYSDYMKYFPEDYPLYSDYMKYFQLYIFARANIYGY